MSPAAATGLPSQALRAAHSVNASASSSGSSRRAFYGWLARTTGLALQLAGFISALGFIRQHLDRAVVHRLPARAPDTGLAREPLPRIFISIRHYTSVYPAGSGSIERRLASARASTDLPYSAA